MDDLSPAKRALLELRLKKAAKAAALKALSSPTDDSRGFDINRADNSLSKIKRRDDSRPGELSFSQQRIWFTQQLEPDLPLYNRPSHIRLRGKLNVDLLAKSLEDILRRHEVLRSIFVESNGEVSQVIQPAAELNLQIHDLTILPESQREKAARQFADQQARAIINLRTGPLFRAGLLKIDESDHVLALTIHHVVFDAWSMVILLRELKTIYECRAAGRPPELPELPIQYTDFAEWQRDFVRGARLEKQLDYWKTQLAGAPPTIDLPKDRTPNATNTSMAGQVWRLLPIDLSSAIKSLSAQEGSTLFITMLAAFNAFLSRYSNQEDIVIGSPIAGRTCAESEPLIGCFINTLVLRTQVNSDMSFRDLLRRAQQTALGAYANQDIPIEMLARKLRPVRDASRLPFFQVMFNFRNVPGQETQTKPRIDPGLEFAEFSSSPGASLVDLSLELANTKAGLECRFIYDSDLFDSSTIERMLGHFQTMLQAIVDDPTQTVGRLPLLQSAERHRLTVDWNQTQHEFSRDRCIHNLFEDHARNSPDGVALRWLGGQLSYGELNDRANCLAGHLRGLGVGPDKLVGVCIRRSPEMIVGVLGILKAGGAYVPLDPDYPQERLLAMVSDSQPVAIVTQKKLRDRFGSSNIPVVSLDDAAAFKSESSSAYAASVNVRPHHLCYVIYTSGSTGIPKGVAVEHHSIVSYIQASCSTFQVSPLDSMVQLASLSFDMSVEEIFLTLCNGATMILRDDDMLQTADGFLNRCAELGVTILDLPTAYFHELAAAIASGAAKVPATVRLVFFGGEAVSPERLTQWKNAVGPDVRLANGYGPTETTVCATMCECAGPLVAKDAKIEVALSDRNHIGRPMPNATAFILDRYLEPTPIGVAGELHIGGEGLARGYLKRPELTAERFIAHPFDKTPGARVYRTGDLVRYRPDGNIEFLGRIDHQVKFRGFRIELGDIESALSRHPAVAQVSVIIRLDQAGDKKLAAYVVLNTSSAAPTADDFRTYLKTRLPEYMLPSAFEVLPSLPLNANSKIDRKALEARPLHLAGHAAQRIMPRDANEAEVARLFGKVLGVESIGATDDFFELGGHSLLAIRLLSMIHEQFGIRLPVATFFAGATVEKIARALRGQCTISTSPLVRLQEGTGKSPYFFIHGDVDGGGLYCSSLARNLGTDHPFYLLQPLGLDGGHAPETIELMARRYIALIREAQPGGPYFLGGFCNGGVIAYEIARQLRAVGQDVAIVTLIAASADLIQIKPFHHLASSVCDLIGIPFQRQVALSLWVQRQVMIWRKNAKAGIAHEARFLAAEIRAAFARMRGKTTVEQADDSSPAGAPLRDSDVSLSEQSRRLLRGIYLAMAGYAPKPYDGFVAYLWPKEQDFRSRRDPVLSWKRAAKKLISEQIPGGHTTCLTEHSVALAKSLRRLLDEAAKVSD